MTARIDAMKAALDADPDNLTVRLLLAKMTLEDLGQDEAFALIRSIGADAEALSDQDRLFLSQAWAAMGNLAKAVSFVDGQATAALRLQSATLKTEMYQLPQAKADYDQAIAQDPSLADPALAARLAVVAGQEIFPRDSPGDFPGGSPGGSPAFPWPTSCG